MFDKVHKYISLFRCNFCLELLPVSGSPSTLDEQKVYLVTENPRKYLKHYHWEDALHMDWVACCGVCKYGGSMHEYLLPEDRVIKQFTPYKDAPTIDALTSLMRGWGVSVTLMNRVMVAAYFHGDRPIL